MPKRNIGCNNGHENKITKEYRGLLRIWVSQSKENPDRTIYYDVVQNCKAITGR